MPSSFPMLAAIAGFVLLSVAFPVVISYWLDRRNHEGLDWFRRRAILTRGQPARAVVLSSELLVGRATGSKYSGAYSIVYEVRPEGAAPFRQRSVEVMWFSEARAQLAEGQEVWVRFDPADGTVLLVRRDARQLLADRDAARRAKEDELLRR